jgi:hypothetical protein
MTNILNRPAKLLVVPEPLSFGCPVLDFETLAEAATYVAERLQTAHVVWALTPEGRNLTRERLVRIHRASQKRRHGE